MADEDENQENQAETPVSEGQGMPSADSGELSKAAEGIDFVVLPLACVNEGKGAPLAMGIQRWWAQELASRGGKAAAPVFTAMAERDGQKVPALMVFREPWTDERAVDGIRRFPNADKALITDIKVDENQISYQAKLVEVRDEALHEIQTWNHETDPQQLPEKLFALFRDLADHFGVELDVDDWQQAFVTKDPQALVSFLVGLGNLSALQGRCVPTTPDQLLSPFVDALNRDAAMDPAMQGLHVMSDILVQNPIDQTAIPLAVQALNVAAQRRKNDQSVHHHLGTLFRRLGDVGSAVQAFNQAFNLDATNATVANQFIATLRAGGDQDNAFKVAQFAVERGNEDPHVLAQLASLMIENEQFDEAEPFLRRAIQEGQVPSAYGDLANVLWDRSGDEQGDSAREDREEALGLLRQAIEQERVDKTTLDMLLDLHEEEGLEDATMLLLEAADKHEENATVLRYVATMYLDGDDPEKARPYLEKILDLQRRSLDDDAFARRGRLQLDIEDFDERYDQAIEQVRSGDPDAQAAAAAFLREIIAKEQRFWQPHLMLALAVRQTEGDTAALAHLMDAVKLRPNDAEIRNLIAAILRKQGRPKEAVDHLRAVVALNPRDVDPVVSLASCMRDANMFEEARQVCQAALQMVPNHPEFTRILQSLPPPSQGEGD